MTFIFCVPHMRAAVGHLLAPRTRGRVDLSFNKLQKIKNQGMFDEQNENSSKKKMNARKMFFFCFFMLFYNGVKVPRSPPPCILWRDPYELIDYASKKSFLCLKLLLSLSIKKITSYYCNPASVSTTTLILYHVRYVVSEYL